jgi:hypothetical protein
MNETLRKTVNVGASLAGVYAAPFGMFNFFDAFVGFNITDGIFYEFEKSALIWGVINLALFGVADTVREKTEKK